MLTNLKFDDINLLKLEPNDNNKSIIGIITLDTLNKIRELYGFKKVKEIWCYKIVLLELDLLIKKIVSNNYYITYVNYKIPDICNNKLVVKIVVNNNKIDFISKYYISKFIKKSLLISFFKFLIN